MPNKEFHHRLSEYLLTSSFLLYGVLQSKTIYNSVANYGGKGTSSPPTSTTTSTSTSWNPPAVSAKIAWFVFESPNLAWSLYSYLNRNKSVFNASPANAVLLSLFVLHYFNRCIIYPLRMSEGSKPMKAVTFLAAFSFCVFNGYLQSESFTQFRVYPPSYCRDPKFIAGVAIFFCGFCINIQSDNILQRLRDAEPRGTYKIPKGGLFLYISCPNFFGEMVEWLGFAIACDSLSAWAFWAWVVANLTPRALSHHKWYLDRFPDYPTDRCALVPFIILCDVMLPRR